MLLLCGLEYTFCLQQLFLPLVMADCVSISLNALPTIHVYAFGLQHKQLHMNESCTEKKIRQIHEISYARDKMTNTQPKKNQQKNKLVACD